MYCVFCGTANPPEARFCYKCGKPLERTAAQAESAPPPSPPVVPTPAPSLDYVPPSAYPYAPAPAYPYTAAPLNPYYAQPTNPYATYNPYPYIPPLDPAQLEYYHPLLRGAVGLPTEFYLKPTAFYSYVTPQNRVAIVKRGSFWQRVGAMLLDLLLLFVPNLVLLLAYTSVAYPSGIRYSQAIVPPWWLYLLFYLINFGYFWLGALRGRTVGKRATRLRIIRLDGRTPDALTAFLRQFCGYLLSASPGLLALLVLSLLSAILFSSVGSINGRTGYTVFILLVGLPVLFFTSLLGFLWVGWDAKKQGWHDKLARTLVVEEVVWVEGQNFGLPTPPNKD